MNGILSQHIHQRLVESNELTLHSVFTQARSLELAQKSCDQYNNTSTLNATSIDDKPSDLNTITSKRTCFFCGGPRHNRQQSVITVRNQAIL